MALIEFTSGTLIKSADYITPADSYNEYHRLGRIFYVTGNGN